MLLNKPRAYEIMDKYGLDGLVAEDRRNVFYLTDFWGSLQRMERYCSTLALLPRREDAPATLIVTASELHRLTHMPTWVPNVIACSYRVKPETRGFDTAIEEPEAGDWITWPKREGAELAPQEQAWDEITSRQSGRWATTPLRALASAIRELGLEAGNLGFDDLGLHQWLQELGMPDLSGVPAVNIFREIRMIKSETEIERMRQAAQRNELGMNAAIAAIHEGAEWSEVETAYMVEMARHGAQGVYITAGPGGLPAGRVRRGEPIMLDALGQYDHYHGDIGRTAVVGEPSKELARNSLAMRTGLDTAFEMLRPGASANQMTRAVLDAVHKAGFEGFLFVTPHSVGLEHTDHPIPIGPELPGSKGDFLFHENMTVNIDMPYHELGWGSMHLEDTVRITKDGFEPLTSLRTELRVLES